MILIEEYMKRLIADRQSHLDLTEECIIRGGRSTNHQGILVAFLNTTFPSGMRVHLCHACHNDKCSNPKHLYFGTPKENVFDSLKNGNLNVWERTVLKYGLEKTKDIARQNIIKSNSSGKTGFKKGNTAWNKGLNLNRKGKKMWITNGIKDTVIEKHLQIPFGWRKGRTNIRSRSITANAPVL